MSDLDTLIVTFQTQLSDVMETVVKTAMYEVTRLVEDGFLEEVKRRNQEVETLRIQLQWAERKLSDQEGKEGGKTGKCVECAKDDVELSCDTAGQSSKEQQDDILRDCGVKKEGDSVERWTSSRQEVVPEMAQAADNPTAPRSPETQVPEEDVLTVVDIKKEDMNKPSCSFVHLGLWSSSPDDGAGPESHSATEKIEAQPKETQEISEELLRNVIKQDTQVSTAYVFPEEQEETQMATDLSLEEDVLVAPGRDQISSSVSPTVRPQNSDALGVTIKQEVIDDSDVESERKEKRTTKSGMASFPCSVRHHRVSSVPHKQNHFSHKATVQEVVKLHSKVGAGLRLQAAIQHLHRPMKRPPHTLSNNSAATLSVAHSQIVNVNPLNRIPSTSKAAASPSLSVQRGHLSDKQAAAHNRTGAPWVSIKTQLQSANSHHTNPLPHPDSLPHTGPRHLLRCGQCGKCFPHPSNLKAHLQTHTGERPFCCSLCGRSFTKLSNLKAHRRVHTGERPYCCLACGKRFTQKCNLKRHQRIHLDV
ncbi:uncharacterized protein [Pagrus major]|uniref:uncharacterized protein n=1 Tax=Pagrus major TaxID=143350 RepID=UPI003CC8C255